MGLCTLERGYALVEDASGAGGHHGAGGAHERLTLRLAAGTVPVRRSVGGTP